MDSRLTSLVHHGRDLTRAEHRVLVFIAEHASLVGKITVRELAQQTYVSTATIMRLCQKMGFSGYSEFIYHCKQLLADTPRSFPATPTSVANDGIPEAYRHFVVNYEKTFTYVTPALMDPSAISCVTRAIFFFTVPGSPTCLPSTSRKSCKYWVRMRLSPVWWTAKGFFLAMPPNTASLSLSRAVEKPSRWLKKRRSPETSA